MRNAYLVFTPIIITKNDFRGNHFSKDRLDTNCKYTKSGTNLFINKLRK